MNAVMVAKYCGLSGSLCVLFYWRISRVLFIWKVEKSLKSRCMDIKYYIIYI